MDSGDKLPGSARPSRERPAQAGWVDGQPVVSALLLGAEVMGGAQGKGPAGPGGGGGLGIAWALPGEGRGPSQSAPLALSLGVLSTTISLPLTSQKQNSGGQRRTTQPLLAPLLLSRALGSHPQAASMWPKLVIHHWRASLPIWVLCGTHRCTHGLLHVHTFVHSQGPREHFVKRGDDDILQ